MSKFADLDVYLLKEHIERARDLLHKGLPEAGYDKWPSALVVEYMFLQGLAHLEVEQEKQEAA